MKPLPVASYTDEDWELMRAATVRWMFRHNGPFPLAQVYVPADRRDAALMLEAQQCAKGNGPSAIEVRGIACRGYNEHGYWIEDTEDGEGVWLR